ncbi:MAG: hypothetical protein LIP23_06265, partial [Planctomycetes bacterium]|nr:hypothetical protein [Planctomycetota bacterium]
MNSRERVIAAIEHRQPDRVPIDFGGHRSSGIMAIAYNRLRDYLGLEKKPAKVYDVIQQLAVIDDDVYERFPTDVMNMSMLFCKDDSEWKEWVLPNGEPCLIPAYSDVRKEGDNWFIYNHLGNKAGMMRPGMLYFDQIFWPYADDGIPEGLPNFKDDFLSQMWGAMQAPPYGKSTEEIATVVKQYRDNSDLAINMIFGGNLYEPSTFMCNIENAMVWMLTEEELFEQLLDKLLEMNMAGIENTIKPLAPLVDVVLFGDDLGMGTGPQF